jgi:hypothetical protein
MTDAGGTNGSGEKRRSTLEKQMGAGETGWTTPENGTGVDAKRYLTIRKRAEDGGKWGTPVSPISPHTTFNIITKRCDNSLCAQGWIGDKTCFATINTGASVNIARPDVATWCLKRNPSLRYMLETVSGDNSHPQGSLSKYDPGTEQIRIWVFIAKVTNEVILGLM